MNRIGIVGSGPTAIYTLRGLLTSISPLEIVIYEKTGTAGTGTPYRQNTNHRALLANIASIELPPVLEPLDDWLQARTENGLDNLGIIRGDVTDRAFFPRVTIGTYYRDQLFRLSEQARLKGHRVEIKVRHEVLDINIDGDEILVVGQSNGNLPFAAAFNKLVVATGHTMDVSDDSEASYFESPYPTSRLGNLQPGSRIGILGTSLSAIDAAIAIALDHGEFVEQDGSTRYLVKPGAKLINLTMMSRGGLIPEADFYCPIPYEPLAVFTQEAVSTVISEGETGLLDRAMALFIEELSTSDPVYASGLNLRSLTADSFPLAYFAPRVHSEPISWARSNLVEVLANHARQYTVQWRYTLLRIHELMERVVPHLDEEDRKRFDLGLKRVFVDNYAAIPPVSVERLLALHTASALEIVRLGDDYEQISSDGLHWVKTPSSAYSFDIFINATGEGRLMDSDVPFAGLRAHLQQSTKARREERLAYRKGADQSAAVAFGGVYMASLPYLLGERPFIQGLVSCNEVGSEIAASIIVSLVCDTTASDVSTRELLQMVSAGITGPAQTDKVMPAF